MPLMIILMRDSQLHCKAITFINTCFVSPQDGIPGEYSHITLHAHIICVIINVIAKASHVKWRNSHNKQR